MSGPAVSPHHDLRQAPGPLPGGRGPDGGGGQHQAHVQRGICLGGVEISLSETNMKRNVKSQLLFVYYMTIIILSRNNIDKINFPP